MPARSRSRRSRASSDGTTGTSAAGSCSCCTVEGYQVGASDYVGTRGDADALVKGYAKRYGFKLTKTGAAKL